MSERGPLTRQAVNYLVAQTGKRAKLKFDVNPHMLRHSTGCFLANKGYDTRLIQDYLGHKKITHTVRGALIFLEKPYAATEPTKCFQMSADGFRGYHHTVNEVLGTKAGYGQVIKIYGKPNPDEIRYSTADCLGLKKRVICGNTDKDRISTS